MVAIALAIVASAVLRSLKPTRTPATPAPQPMADAAATSEALIPTLALCVGDGATEAVWVDALLPRIAGQKEVVIPNGRIDVVTTEFAMEVDFLKKWHEGIGQALHYASATAKRPALALIVQGSEWPLAPDRMSLLREIDRIAAEQKIRLVVLRPGGCDAVPHS